VTPTRTAVLDSLGLDEDQRRAVEALLDAELHAAGARLAAVLAEGHTLTTAVREGTAAEWARVHGRVRLVQVLEGWQTPDGDGAALALHERWRDR